mgnify:CR=1 FL=1
MLILIDNYDSFTYNIVQMLGTAPPGAPADWQPPELSVFRNDAVTVAALMALSPTRLIVSPGPCTPSEAGISVRAILAASSREPPIPVPGPPGHRPGLWRQGAACAQTHARQNEPRHA